MVKWSAKGEVELTSHCKTMEENPGEKSSILENIKFWGADGGAVCVCVCVCVSNNSVIMHQSLEKANLIKGLFIHESIYNCSIIDCGAEFFEIIQQNYTCYI